MFTITKKELGTLKVGKEVSVEYPYTDIKIITRMESPCDCSVPHDIRTNNKVIIKYTPKPIPQHLKLEGKKSYKVEKTITVNFLDSNKVNRIQNLVFTATIIE